MKHIKTFESFLHNLNQEEALKEKANWKNILGLGGWSRAKDERERAESEMKDDKLKKRNSFNLSTLKGDYDQYKSNIKKNFKNTPELMHDKLTYLDHFFWASMISDDGWNITDLKRISNWEQVMKDGFNPRKNPYGASWPIKIWWEDLKPDLEGIDYTPAFAKGYSTGTNVTTSSIIPTSEF